jgi:predicted RNase H-like nuclease (RuvC/YqgF family)
MLPSSALVVLADAGSSTNPVYAVFLALIGGSLIAGAVAVYKARPERDLTVASTAEKQVVLSMSMLAGERERADRAEKRATELEAELEVAEAELVAMRTEVADLTRRLEAALTRTRASRDHNRQGGTPP